MSTPYGDDPNRPQQPPSPPGAPYGHPAQPSPPPQQGEPNPFQRPAQAPGPYQQPGPQGPYAQPGPQGPYVQPGQPGPYASPGPYATPGPPPGSEYLGATVTPGGPAPRRSRTKIWIAAGAAVAVLAGTATAGAYVANRVGGGGAHPYDRLPSSAIAYAELDLDPSAEQKINGIRFARKFPELRSKFAEDKDPRRSLWELLSEDDADLKKIDYKTEIEPWLGERIGLAVLAPAAGQQLDSDEHVVVALQVRDEGKARTGLQRLNDVDAGDDDVFFAFSDGYAILADSQATADRAAADAGRESLADKDTFADDSEKTGDRGVSSGWVDLAAMGQAMASAAPNSVEVMRKALVGRFSYAVRFDGDDLEVVADGHAIPEADVLRGGGSMTAMRNLPRSTILAVGLTNGEAMVDRAWGRLRDTADGASGAFGGQNFDELVRDFERETGLSLPADLKVLFGRDMAFGIDEQDVAENPRLGVRATTDAARAEEVLRKLVESLDSSGSASVVTRRTPDGYVAATTESYADELSKDGSLGEDSGFKAALPDLEKADFAAYADVDKIVAAQGTSIRVDKAQIEAVDGVGITLTGDGDGETRFRIKVVTK
jgi:hypothetical protein